MRTESLDKPALLRLLLYGDSGAGKTRLIGSAMDCEDTCPLLVLNIRGQPITLRVFDTPPCIVTLEQMTDFNAPYEWLLGGQSWDVVEKRKASSVFFAEVYKYLSKWSAGRPIETTEVTDDDMYTIIDPRKFRTVAIDQLTQTQRMALNEVSGNLRKLPGDLMKATEIQQWGTNLGQMVNLMDLYFDLPLHVIIAALTRHDDVPSFGTKMYYPHLQGQSSLFAPALAEIVGRLVAMDWLMPHQKKSLEDTFKEAATDAFNILLTRGGRRFFAKWQGLKKPPEYVLAPTVQKLIDVMRSSS